MANAVEVADFWLPAEFFDDFVTGKDILSRNKESGGDGLLFPIEFPYDLDTPPSLHLPSTIKGGRIWSSAGSAGGSSNSSPIVVHSPQTALLGDPIGDLIHLAAGPVPKLKLNGGDDSRAILTPRNLNRFHAASPRNPNPNPFQNNPFQQHYIKKHQDKQGWYGEPQMHQPRRPVRHNPTRISGSGEAVSRDRAGTGVFLPRRYGNSKDDSLQKIHSAFVPERNANVVNKNFNRMNGFVQSQPKSINRGFHSNYGSLAQRSLVILQQHRLGWMAAGRLNPPVTCGICLPQEWTY